MKKIPLALLLVLTVVLIGQAWLNERQRPVLTTWQSVPTTSNQSHSPATAPKQDSASEPAQPAVAQGSSAPQRDEDADQRRIERNGESKEEEEEERRRASYSYAGRVTKYVSPPSTTRRSKDVQFIGQAKLLADGSMEGVRMVMDAPIQQTTKTLMDNQAKAVVVPGKQRLNPEREVPGRGNRPQNPNAPAVASWPVDPKPSSSNGLLAAPQTVSTNFDGATLTDTGAFPPDTMGTVGPTQYFVFVNGRLRTFNKTTGMADGVINADPDVFFASVMTPVSPPVVLNFTSDPNVRYDRFSARWFLTIIDVPCTNGTCTTTAANRQMIAVSDAASNGVIGVGTVWSFFQFQGDPGTNFLDYPSLGIDVNALYIGGNMFSNAGSFVGTNGYVVQKSSVLGVGPGVATAFANLAAGAGAGPFAPRGVDNFDPSATEGYLVGVDNATFSTMMFRRVSSPGSAAPTISGNISVTVPTTTSPNPVTHTGNTGGNNGRLDSLDDRLFAAMVRNGRLWTAHNFRVSAAGVANTAAAARNASRWYEFQNLTTTPTVVQSGTVFDNAATLAASLQHFIPSITVSGQGHAVIGFTVAGAIGATPGFTGRLASDTLGTMSGGPPTSLANTFGTTTANYNPPADPGGASGRRWGDYSFTSVDPKDDMTIWTIQEYNQASNSYAVRVAKLLAPPPATPSLANAASVAAGQASVNVIITGTSTSGSGFYDPGANLPAPALPFNHIAASVTGGVTVNSVTYTDPTHITLNISTVGASTGLQTVTVTNPDGQMASGMILTITSAVLTSPTMHKAFGAASIQAGGNTTVTLTLNNPNATPLTGAAFTDTLTNMSALGGAVTGSCVGTTPATLSAGATALSFSGIGIPATGSCTVVFSVTSSTLGTHANTTSGITTTQTPTAGPVSNPASLTVYGAPTIAKAFAPMAITAGGTSTVTVTVTNPNPIGLIAAFSDTLANMSAVGGVVGGSCAMLAPTVLAANATALNFSGVILPASGSCTLSFGVRSNSVGSQPNATSGVTTDRTPAPGAVSNTATLTVSAPSMTTIAKAFSPATIPLGGTSTVQLTLTNTNPVGALASFTDNLTGMVAVGGNIGGTCGLLAAVNLTTNSTALSFSGIVVPGAGNCLVTFDVKGTVAGAQSNTTSGVVTDQTTPNAGPPSNTATLTVVPTTIAKVFAPASIVSGGTSTVTVTLNNGNSAAVLASFTDTLANMTAVGGPIGTTCASLATINLSAGATNLSFSGLVIPGAGSCTVSFPVTSNVVGSHPNTTSGVTMNSSGVAGPVSNTATLTVSGARPTLARKAVRNDFDGDRISDLAVFNRESGEWQVKFSGDNEVHRIQLVEPNDKEVYVGVAADFDGDGQYDAGVFSASNGRWLIKQSSNGELVKAQFGLVGDTPMAADYDGDGKADLAVNRKDDGWHILRTSDNTEQTLYLGQADDVPVIGDLDGDGQTDIATFRAADGHWLWRSSATGQISDVLFGQAGDTPVAPMLGDFDGDGKDDFAVRRAGTIYVLRSIDQSVEAVSLSDMSEGESFVFGDYDGDRKAELAIWRTAKAAWDILFNQKPR